MLAEFCDDTQVQQGCPKTCGVCGLGSATLACEDTHVETCALLAEFCYDVNVQKGCRATCGICVIPGKLLLYTIIY